MSEILDVPVDLHGERDAVIQHAIFGVPASRELAVIEHWFSNDQAVWNDLHSEASAMHFEPAVVLKNAPILRACDSELRDELGLDESEKITDEMRCAFVRDLINEDSDSSELVVGIGQRWLQDDAGNNCLIGFIEELEGQCGMVCYWQGVFATESLWHEFLSKNGYKKFDRLEDISEEVLLSLYYFDE